MGRRVGRTRPATGGHRWGATTALALALAATTATASGDPATARAASTRPPGTTVTAVTTATSTVTAGGRLRITDTTRNLAPRGTTPRSYTVYLASRDRAVGAGDRLLGQRPVRALAHGSGSRRTVTVTLSPAIAPGRYHLIACTSRATPAPRYRPADCHGAAHPFAVTAPSPGAPGTPLGAGTFTNPVFGGFAGDPTVIDVGGHHDNYWAFSTGDRFPALHSADLAHWTPAPPALTTRPPWVAAVPDWHPWAPTVTETSDPCPGAVAGPCYVMHHVGLSATTGANCLAVATASGPGGPYTEQGPLTAAAAAAASPEPIGCGDAASRANIDPFVLRNPDGSAYLYLSADLRPTAGSRGGPTLSVIPLSPDLLHATGPRTPLLSGTPGSWEAVDTNVPIVENPVVLRHGGLYYLLYSGGSWHTRYGEGYATAGSPTGPFAKSPRNPFIAQTATVLSPGGAAAPVVGPHGAQWLPYHARSGSYQQPRSLRLDRFWWQPTGPGQPDAPSIDGPTGLPRTGLP